MFLLMFLFFLEDCHVKVRKGTLRTVKMSVMPQVMLLLPGTSSSPREEDPTAIRRSPLPRIPLLEVALLSLPTSSSAGRSGLPPSSPTGRL
jgi:hypothetical protein